MAKISTRCLICTHPQLAEILEDRYRNKLTYAQLSAKYFPDKKGKSYNKSWVRHFQHHINLDEEVRTTSANMLAVINARGRVPMPSAAKAVFEAQAKERISATFTLEQMMRVLMEKVNHFEEQWDRVRDETRCSECGRDDNDRNLAKMLAVIREIRELNTELVKIKNPLDMIKRFFNETFGRFVEEISLLYSTTLTEKGHAVREVFNDYLEDRISSGVALRKLTELGDLGSDELSNKAADRLRIILKDAMKQIEKAS